MKKIVITVIILAIVIFAAATYLLSGSDDFIHNQIEQQGSRILETNVEVASVSLSFKQGVLDINEVAVANPFGFSDESALSLNQIILDLGSSLKQPYVVDEVRLQAPEVLYEVDENGKGNLIVLKDNLEKNLQLADKPETGDDDRANPLLIVNKVTVADTRLRLNFEKLQTGDLELDKKSYDVTLPTFNAGPIGQPDGLPADQVANAILRAMLDNLIKEAKAKAKERLKDEAKEKAKEKLEQEKDKLLDKAGKKLKDLIGNG